MKTQPKIEFCNELFGTALSPIAEKLYKFLVKTCGAHETKCEDYLFDKPKYPETNDREMRIVYWQWESNLYGNKNERVVFELENGKYEMMEFYPTVERNYSSLVSDAYQELRRNGLVFEKNNGYNSYTFYPVKLWQYKK